MNILVFDKTNRHDLVTPYLTLNEYRCRCIHTDCTRTLILKSNIDSFRKVRDRYSHPIRITSGFRCQRHNLDVGGKFQSYHKIGAAMDIQPWTEKTPDCMDSAYQEKIDRLEECAKRHYDVVIRYSTFLHCHNFGDHTEEQ